MKVILGVTYVPISRHDDRALCSSQIQWLPNDVEDPQAFSLGTKWTVTAINAAVTLVVALASSTYAGASLDIAISFRELDEEIVILGKFRRQSHFEPLLTGLFRRVVGISLFVLGFAFGPLVWGPLSEIYGRRWILIVGRFQFSKKWSQMDHS